MLHVNKYFDIKTQINLIEVVYMGEKKIFSTRVDGESIKLLKHLAVDTEKSLGELLEEAIKDIVKKYEKKIIR